MSLSSRLFEWVAIDAFEEPLKIAALYSKNMILAKGIWGDKRVSGQKVPFLWVQVPRAWFGMLVGLRPCTNTISIDALSTLGPFKTLMFA